MEMKALIVCLVFLTIQVQGQNLILNGGFEEYYSCPRAPGDFEFCRNWYLANYSTPDYFRRCSEGSAAFNIPYNHAGMQEPNSGNAYVGLFLLSGEKQTHREYIQGELCQKLDKGKKYSVSFYVSWGDFFSTFCDRVGFSFSHEKIIPKKKLIWDFEPLVKSDGCVSLKLDSLKNRNSWHLVKFEYTAKSNEKFLTIGLFEDNLSKKDFNKLVSKEHIDKYARKKEAYLYIDDVLVVAVDGKGEFSHQIKKREQ
jgi:OOP family OmpA-OmpF porin